MPKDIKSEFGRLMRLSRDAKGMSRATLATRLGISPKTIQSWEMGRTFIERLDLIPQLEVELECSLSSLIARATGAAPAAGSAAEANDAQAHPSAFGELPIGAVSQQRVLTRPGPLSPRFTLTTAAEAAVASDEEGLEVEWASVPMLKPAAVLNPVFGIQPRDILRHVLIPREWVPRAGVLVAVRMGDSAMMPMIPLGSVVVLDLRPIPLEKALGRIAALDFAGKGLRIRQVRRDMMVERYYGASITEHGRAQMQIRPQKGDRVLGGVVGVLAQVS